jgi:hypothetical protein
MNASSNQFDLRELLQAEGAQFGRGKRPPCPRCGKRGTLSIDLDAGVFCCHNAACDFRGNSYTLARAQGRLANLSPAERRVQAQAFQRAREAGAVAAARTREELRKLHDQHIELQNIQDNARAWLLADEHDEPAWAGLQFSYQQLPRVRAAIALLEEGPVDGRLDFLDAGEEQRESMIDRVVRHGGLFDEHGRFLEVTY